MIYLSKTSLQKLIDLNIVIWLRITTAKKTTFIRFQYIKLLHIAEKRRALLKTILMRKLSDGRPL